MTDTATNRLDDIKARARLAMDRNIEARWTHSWLIGPGRYDEGRYGESTRLSAERGMRTRGWTLDQLDAYIAADWRPKAIPLKKAQEDEPNGWWSPEVQAAVDANENVLRALARQSAGRQGPQIWREMSEAQRATFRRWMPKMAEAWESGRTLQDQEAVDEGRDMFDSVVKHFSKPSIGFVQAVLIAGFGVMLGCMWARLSPRTAQPVVVALQEATQMVPSHPDITFAVATRPLHKFRLEAR